MKGKKEESLSLIVALLPFLLFGVLYLTPAYAGPETLGPTPADQRNLLGASRPPAQYADDTADDDADSAETTGEVEVLPLVKGQVSSLEKKAAPLRAASGFDAFNAGYGNQWKANFSEKTGKVKVLYGALSKKYEDGPESVARGFLADSHSIFGLMQDLSDLRIKRVDKTPERNHVRFEQTYNNVPIVGAQVLVHSNPQGQVTMVQNSYLQGFQVANAQVIAAEAAKNIAVGDLQIKLGKGAALFAAKVKQVIAPRKGKYYYVWKIAVPTQNPLGYWVYNVDAATGEILYKGNEILSLKKGKGRAYTSNYSWLLGNISNVTLKKMFGPAETPDWGYLSGAHAEIYDYFDGEYYWMTVYSPTYSFLYDPVSKKGWFDATDAYYQLNTVWDWWNKNVVNKYTPYPHLVDYFSEPYVTGSYYPIPAIVKCVDLYCQCNAFYASDLGGVGYPGFAFGDDDTCLPDYPNEDLVIDSDVVRHEYAHAMMDWMGFSDGGTTQFGGPFDYYGRAMGEGNSDWFAFLNHTKDPLIAEVAFYFAGGYLRNLDNTRMYPRDVGLANYPLPGQTMPEEHYTGEIWGGYLFDLYRVLKKKALKYVFNSFYYFDPADGFMDSLPDFFDGIRAQMVAEYDLTGNYKSSVKAWGSMASRGINGMLRSTYCHNPYFGTGVSGCDDAWSWAFSNFKTITTSGNVLVSGDSHEYVIYFTSAGWDLTATVTAKSGGMINPSIYLYDGLGTLMTSVGPSSPTEATLTSNSLPAGGYVVRVTGANTAPARGYYTLKLTAK